LQIVFPANEIFTGNGQQLPIHVSGCSILGQTQSTLVLILKM